MKKTLAWALALMLTLCLSAAALAESNVASSYTLEAEDVMLNPRTNAMAVRKLDSSTYVLMNADGQELTSEGYIQMDVEDSFFEVAVESGVNVHGLIDSEGNEVMPMSYGDVEALSDRWTMGAVLEEATADNYDYKSWGGDAFYLVSTYDFYFRGAKVGSLGRTEYSYATPHGNFLYVQDVAGNYSYYDSAFTKSAYTGDDSSSEYEERYSDNSFWHRGSGQQAFVPSCTLTPDDVEVSIKCIDDQFYDLQGNPLFSTAGRYEYVYEPEGGYMRVEAFDKYGLIDVTGREIIPCQYDEVGYSDTYFGAGYQRVVKDGKVGYVDLNGNETTEFKYSASLVSSITAPFTDLQDLEGNLIVISAAVGELPETYSEVSYGRDAEVCPLLAVATDDDHAGVIDLNGNMIIPADGTYNDVYDLDLSDDGTLVVGYGVDYQYTVYHVEHTASEAAAADAPAGRDLPAGASLLQGASNAPAEDAAAGQDAGAESWSCPSCNTQNTGNFCTECGTSRPEESASCASCGHVFEDGVPTKFCPDCGAQVGE